MPAFLLSLLGSSRAWTALGVAALLVFAGLQTARLSHAKADLAAARAAALDPTSRRLWRDEAAADAGDLAACRASLAQLNAAAARQSDAVAALARQDQTDSAAARVAVAQAGAASAEAAKRAARILASPAASGDCPAADALILGSLQK